MFIRCSKDARNIYPPQKSLPLGRRFYRQSILITYLVIKLCSVINLLRYFTNIQVHLVRQGPGYHVTVVTCRHLTYKEPAIRINAVKLRIYKTYI